jgi:hypothetical protein
MERCFRSAPRQRAKAVSGNAAWQRAGTAASAAKRNVWARARSPDLTRPTPKPPRDYWQIQTSPRTEHLREWDAQNPVGIAEALSRFSPVYVQGLEETFRLQNEEGFAAMQPPEGVRQ